MSVSSVGVSSADRARLSDVSSGSSALHQSHLFALYLALLEVHSLVAREMSARTVEAAAAQLHDLAAHTVELLKVRIAVLLVLLCCCCCWWWWCW
jgi:hypothetical protein